MANLNIAIQIAAQDQASGPIGRIKNTIGGLATSARQGFGGLGSIIQTGLLGAATVATGGLLATAVAVAGVGSASVDMASQVRQSQNDIQASLGATQEEAEQLGDVAVNVFKNNFGASIEETTAVVIEARKQLGDLADIELQDAAENALRLSDTFQLDVNESLSAAGTLTEEFGLSQQEAFDFITAGMQKGLNSSGDFLDSIGEYSTQFAEGGASADEFFSLMESGLGGGMLGTDKAADAFKEFRVRIQDGSKMTADSLAAIGINADELAASMADGSVTASDAFQMVLDALRDVDDQNVLMQAGVGLLGTQFEDLGQDTVLALDTMGTSMEDLAGATDKLDVKYKNFGSMWEGIKRRALVALVPIGENLLELANGAMPLVEGAFGWFETTLPPVLERVQSGLNSVIEIVRLLASGDFRGGIFGLHEDDPFIDFLFTVRETIVGQVIPGLQQLGTWLINEGWPAFQAFITPIIDQVVPGLKLIGEIALNIVSTVFPIWLAGWQLVIDNLNIILPVLGVVGAVILAIQMPILLLAGAVVLLATAWANNWGGIQEKTQAVIDFVAPYINSFLTSIQTWWTEHGAAVMSVVTFLWETIKLNFQTAIALITVAIQVGLALIGSWWQQHGDLVMTLVSLVWDNIKTVFNAGITIVTAIFEAFRAAREGDWRAFGEQLRIIWDTAWGAIKTILANQVIALGAIAREIIDSIISFFTETDWVGVGAAIAEGLARGIAGGATIIAEAAMDAARAAYEAAKGFLGISSPSTLFEEEVGENIDEGAAKGILGNMGVVQDAMTTALQPPASAGAGAGQPARGLTLPKGGGGSIFNITILANSRKEGEAAGGGFTDELKKRGFAPV